jgi:hypothetical protein
MDRLSGLDRLCALARLAHARSSAVLRAAARSKGSPNYPAAGGANRGLSSTWPAIRRLPHRGDFVIVDGIPVSSAFR